MKKTNKKISIQKNKKWFSNTGVTGNEFIELLKKTAKKNILVKEPHVLAW